MNKRKMILNIGLFGVTTAATYIIVSGIIYGIFGIIELQEQAWEFMQSIVVTAPEIVRTILLIELVAIIPTLIIGAGAIVFCKAIRRPNLNIIGRNTIPVSTGMVMGGIYSLAIFIDFFLRPYQEIPFEVILSYAIVLILAVVFVIINVLQVQKEEGYPACCGSLLKETVLLFIQKH